MAIRFFSDPVRVLSVGRNAIQVLLIRSDPVRVLSIRSDPIRSRFCHRPKTIPFRLNETKIELCTCHRLPRGGGGPRADVGE